MTHLSAFAGVSASALAEWRTALGAAHVVADGAALAAADRACCGRRGGVAAVLYPADETQVRQCLAVARRRGARVHPVSTGRNWGYGSRQPPEARAAVMSLQRLNGIAGLDRVGARARLQPGVTFGALAAWLRREAPELLAPEIGAGPDASVLGNALAGGLGKGPYGWMARRLSDLKLAMPDGSIVRLENVARSGLGEAARGGVALEASFQLCQAPVFRALAWARLVDGAGALASALELALPLASERDRHEQVELLNGARLRLQSPGLAAGPGEGVHAGWLLALTLWGQDEAEIAWRLARAQRRLGRLPTVAVGAEAVERVADLPAPDRQGLTSAYTLTGRPPPVDADPDRDGCGVRWISPLLPSSSAAAVAALDALGACAIAHGFPPALAVRLPDGDPVGLLGLFWNRNGPAAEVARSDARAAACAAAFRSEAGRLGLVLYSRDAGEARAKTLVEAQ